MRTLFLLQVATVMLAGCVGKVGPTGGMPNGGGAGDDISDPGAPVTQAFECKDTETSTLGSRRIWRLTRGQYDSAAQALWGSKKTFAAQLSEEVGQNGFLNSATGLRVRSAEVTQFQKAASELAQEAAGTAFSAVFPCGPGKGSDGACQKQFVERMGSQAFRRPLTSAETTRYQSLFGSLLTLQDEKLAVQGVIEAMLQSPYFLFRTELGVDGIGDRTVLTPYEVASAMSFALTDASPDEALRKAAADGSLMDEAVRKQHSIRLLATDRGRGTALQFYRFWLRYRELATLEKSETLVPDFPSIRGPLLNEIDALVTEAIEKDDFAALFSSNHAFLSKATAALWDEPAPASNGSLRVSLSSSSPRKGILSHPALLSLLATDSRTSIVARGKFVREQFFCDVERDPPGDADLTVPVLTQGLSRRAQLVAKTAPAECASCHVLYNPAGFGMEDFDAVGRFRTQENGLPIDASGELVVLGDADGPFRGTAALATKIARSSDAKRCVSVQMFRYLMGRSESAQDGCALKEAHRQFELAQFRLGGLPMHLLTSPQFIQRLTP
jgi:Protein of unknown function (DUF1592)/Protein of unknown function (DUF1588)/Protein of unknown function (DUF1595)/Protein of unknown function (DUF1585)/Protein of unknown function (DUF1587)